MNILHITSLLPSEVQNKQDENDILIRIARKYAEAFPKDDQQFILILPYANGLLAKIKSKWKDYYKLHKKGSYKMGEFHIPVISMPYFIRDDKIKRQLTKAGYLKNEQKINEIIEGFKPDVIHAHNLKGNTELAQILYEKHKIPFIATMRNDSAKMAERIIQGNVAVSALVSVNQYTIKKYAQLQGIPMEVIPHPVDEQYFVEKITLSQSEVAQFVSAGRLLALKHFDKVIEALSKLDHDFQWDIFGDGPEYDNLQNMIHDRQLQQKVKLRGRIPFEELVYKLSEYDLFIMPSFPETLGRVYFESMARAVPVIGAYKAGVDGIIKDGREGYLVDHRSLDSIKNKIEEFLSLNKHDQYQMKLKCFNLARKYTWQKSLEKYKRLYEYAIEHSKPYKA